MVDIKEIKHIRAAPFTLMSSSIHAILAFIAAILIVLFFGSIAAFIPGAGMFAAFIAVLGLAIIILYPLTAFFWNILSAFVVALLYNLIAPKVGGIKLGMEGDELKSLPVVSVALILACVAAVVTFLIGLYMGLAGSSVLSLISGVIPIAGAAVANATNATNATVPTGGLFGAISGIWALFWIILMPIMAFIFSFIGYALFAIFYNIIIPKVGGMKLIFAEAVNGFELTNIPVVPAALSISVVSAVLGAIYGFISGIMTGDFVVAIIWLVMYAIMYFIMYFIIVALATIFYNFLQPRIGGIKLVLE
ncbi:hypothetical protein [Methanobacterium ferruginis]|uniref:hypothetical protein n=1 Tax=Methanobacterium ferruginis TaxID=710191 RepID=UPI002572DF38|nr:hypothetical protein [Methanobacterium ferruginis]BDZ67429.1 hypothetical protein GCM10025860_08770 [Methanobacterium ferruginis]